MSEHAESALRSDSADAFRRVDLRFADFQAAIDDIRRLQKGCVQTGQWTLAQNCYHIDLVTKARLKEPPFPPNSDEQNGRAEILREILATGRIPKLIAPDFLQPPATADESAIESCVKAFDRCKTHTNFSPHRLFGTMSDADARRHILIHAAHHLSFLVPQPEK